MHVEITWPLLITNIWITLYVETKGFTIGVRQSVCELTKTRIPYLV